MSTATARRDFQLYRGPHLKVIDLADEVMELPADQVLAVKCSDEADCATLQIQVSPDLANQFRRKTLHRLAESGARSEDVRRDRLVVAAELLPALGDRRDNASWLIVSLVTQFDDALGRTIVHPGFTVD